MRQLAAVACLRGEMHLLSRLPSSEEVNGVTMCGDHGAVAPFFQGVLDMPGWPARPWQVHLLLEGEPVEHPLCAECAKVFT